VRIRELCIDGFQRAVHEDRARFRLAADARHRTSRNLGPTREYNHEAARGISVRRLRKTLGT
jgi:hypothetical protein